MSKPVPFFTDPASLPDDYYFRHGEILRVIDGDTIDIDVSLGFDLRMRQRFRLYGIDTPERGKPNWAEATAELRRLAPAGTRCTMRSYKPNALPKSGAFGRWLVEIFVGDINVNQAMMDSGFAVPFMRDS